MTQGQGTPGSDYLQQLLGWWQVELEDTRESQLRQRSKRPWAERHVPVR